MPKHDMVGDVKEANFLLDDELLHDFLSGIAKRGNEMEVIREEDMENFVRTIEVYIKARREGRSPAELAELLIEAIDSGKGRKKQDEKEPPYIFAVDKLGSDVGKLNALKDSGKGGRVSLSSKNKDLAIIVHVENMPNVKEISAPLTQVDLLLHNVMCSMYHAGKPYVTMTELYKAIFGKKPSGEQSKRLEELLYKQGAVRVIIDTEGTGDAFGYRVSRIDSPLLPFVIEDFKRKNGQKERRLIFLKEPPLLTNAIALKQFSAINMEVLRELPQSILSEGTAARLNYINVRVARMKKNHGGSILWETYFEEVAPDIDEHIKPREKKKALEVLQSFKEAGIIKNYSSDKAKITIEK